MGFVDAAGTLDFYSHLTTTEHKIHFQAGFGTPKAHFKIQLAQRIVGDNFHQDKMLKRFAKLLAALLIQLASDKCAGNTNVEQIEFGGCADDLPGLHPFERKEKSTHQGVN